MQPSGNGKAKPYVSFERVHHEASESMSQGIRTMYFNDLQDMMEIVFRESEKSKFKS